MRKKEEFGQAQNVRLFKTYVQFMTDPGREPARDTCMKRHVEINFHQEQVVSVLIVKSI